MGTLVLDSRSAVLAMTPLRPHAMIALARPVAIPVRLIAGVGWSCRSISTAIDSRLAGTGAKDDRHIGNSQTVGCDT